MLTEFSGENLVVPLAMKLIPAQMQLHHLLVGDFDTAWIGPGIGLGVSWKIVPAVTDLCRPQRPRSNQALRTDPARSCPHCGHRKPSGQRR